jgi:hypothetical protein
MIKTPEIQKSEQESLPPGFINPLITVVLEVFTTTETTLDLYPIGLLSLPATCD